jgi:hypothetical protein
MGIPSRGGYFWFHQQRRTSRAYRQRSVERESNRLPFGRNGPTEGLILRAVVVRSGQKPGTTTVDQTDPVARIHRLRDEVRDLDMSGECCGR